MFSQSCRDMIVSCIGYRDNEYGNSGEVDIRKVITFEIIELGNLDIITTMMDNYSDFPLRYTDEELEKNIMDSNFADKCIDTVIEYVSNRLNSNNINVMWFTTGQGLLDNYAPEIIEDKDDYLDWCKYKIPTPFLIISDLGDQGSLFAYANK